MPPTIRPAAEDDWPGILNTAHAALPWDAEGNAEWLANRKAFDGKRFHLVAETNEGIVGYGAIEEGPVPDVYRIFMVMAPERLDTLGAALYDKLAAKLHEWNAVGTWVREYTKDEATVAFFRERGLVEANRFTPEGYEEMIVLKSGT